MQAEQMLGILSGNAENGTPLSIEERVASLPPALILRTFDVHARIAENIAQKKTLNEVVCRLLASGMPAKEIAMILCVKAEIIDDARRGQKELIAKYAKQLKGRRQRAKSKRNGT